MKPQSKIILIRHGKADLRDTASDDTQRKLTKKGIRDLQKMMPALTAHLDPAEAFRIYSSPLLRAVGTAQIIARHLHLETVNEADWVADGDFAGLEQTRKSLEPRHSLIITGHEPTLSEWGYQLSGCVIPFRKGTAVGFRILTEEPLRAEPKWFLTPDLIADNRDHFKQNQPVLQGCQKILRAQIQEILNMYQLFRENPNGPEYAHQFRVKIRTFRSMLNFIKPLIPPEKYADIQEKLKFLAQEIGTLREIDVLRMTWEDLRKKAFSGAGKESPLSAALKSEREFEQARVSDSLSEKTLPTLFEIWRWVEEDFTAEPTQSRNSDNEKPAPLTFKKYSVKRFNAWKKKALFLLKSLNPDDLESVHSMRIQFKELRYALAVLNPVLEIEDDSALPSLKKLQDIFGDYCDTERNLTILKTLNEKYPSSQMAWECGIMSGYQIQTGEEKMGEIKNVKTLPLRS